MLIIPETVVDWLRERWRSRWVDLLWWVFVTTTILVVSYLLIAVSPVFGAIIVGFVLTTLLSDELRGIISDVYNRDVWRR